MTRGLGERTVSIVTHFSYGEQCGASSLLGPTEAERIAYYRDLAAQFRGWAEDETNQEARDQLLERARQYERLANQRDTKSG